MQITRDSDRQITVTLTQNPSAADAQTWIDRIKTELEGTEQSAAVDLTGLEVISSLAVNVVVGLYKAMEKQGGTISVSVRDERMMRVFELFQLTRLFEVRVAEAQ